MNSVAPSGFILQENEAMPNNPELPVLVYRKIFDTHTADKHKKFQQCFEQNGWQGIWKNGLYDYHHFHSASHEALGIANGVAEIQLGGEGGKTLTLEAGDLIVLPAGTGHKRLSASENLVIIGAYPAGQEHYDLCRHKYGDHKKASSQNQNGSQKNQSGLQNMTATISAVPLPQSDPIYGANGPLLQQWRNTKRVAEA